MIVARDGAIVAAQPGDDLLVTPSQLVHLGALTIEGRDRLVVIW
jgi:hypothetical protein